MVTPRLLIVGCAFLAAAIGLWPAGEDLAVAAPGGAVVCDQAFALCSYAPCRPIPGDPTRALCDCAVFDGPNVGNQTCDERAGRAGPYGLRAIQSAFSLREIPTRPLMSCPEGSIWTQCLDAPCLVDPTDPARASCTCDVQTSQVGQTYGGDCDVASCATSFWSAATAEQVASGIAALAKAQGVAPPENRLCPAP